jgi:hypothetical protein
MAGILEGWKAIGEALGMDTSSSAIRKRLRGWELEEGLPVRRLRGRVFATVIALQTWAGNPNGPEQLVTPRR